MPSENRSRSLLLSFRFAFAGIARAVGSQRNMKIHLLAAVVVFAMALWLQVALVEWAVLVMTVATVLVAEMLNTAIEAVVDLASPEFHDLAKAAKDIAAGAVLIAAICAVIVGGMIFGPLLW